MKLNNLAKFILLYEAKCHKEKWMIIIGKFPAYNQKVPNNSVLKMVKQMWSDNVVSIFPILVINSFPSNVNKSETKWTIFRKRRLDC